MAHRGEDGNCDIGVVHYTRRWLRSVSEMSVDVEAPVKPL